MSVNAEPTPHTHIVRHVAPTPDDRLVLSAGFDGAVCVWDVETGSLVATLRGHTAGVYRVAVLDDGVHAASGGADRAVAIYELTPVPRVLSRCEGHTDLVRAIVPCHRNACFVSGSDDGTVRVWRATTGELLATCVGHIGKVRALAVTADGATIISGSDDSRVMIWSLPSGAQRFVLEGHTEKVRGVAAATNSVAVSVSDDATLRVWCITSGKLKFVCSGHTAWIRTVACTPDGTKAFSGGYDCTCRLWDIANGGRCLAVYRQPLGHGWLRSVVCSPCGRWGVAGSYDTTICVWDLSIQPTVPGDPDTMPPTACHHYLEGHEDIIMSVAVSHDGRKVFSASTDLSVQIRAIDDGTTCPPSASTDGASRLLHQCGGTNMILNVSVSPDGRHAATGGADKVLRVWDVATKTQTAAVRAHTGWVRCVAFSPAGNTLVSGSGDKSVVVWRFPEMQRVTSLDHKGMIISLAFSPTGKSLLVGNGDRAIYVYATATYALTTVYTGHFGWIRSVRVTPDCRHVVSSSGDMTVAVWRMIDEDATPHDGPVCINAMERQICDHTHIVPGLALTNDGAMAITASYDKTLRLFGVCDGVEHGQLLGHTAWVRWAAVPTACPDRVVSASYDGSSRIFDLASKCEIARFDHPGAVLSVAATPSCDVVVTGCDDGRVRFFLTLDGSCVVGVNID